MQGRYDFDNRICAGSSTEADFEMMLNVSWAPQSSHSKVHVFCHSLISKSDWMSVRVSTYLGNRHPQY